MSFFNKDRKTTYGSGQPRTSNANSRTMYGSQERFAKPTTPTAPTRTPTRGYDPMYGAPIGQTQFPGQRASFDPQQQWATPEWATELQQLLTQMNDGGAGGAGGASGSGGIGASAAKDYSAQADVLRGEALAAALQALTADFDVQEGMLDAEEDTFQGIFDKEKASISKGRSVAKEGAWSAGTNRGLLRSGIMKQGLAAADSPFATRTAENIAKYNPEEGAQGSEYRRIESALKLLLQQEDTQKREIEIDSERQQLDSDQQLAMILAGMGG